MRLNLLVLFRLAHHHIFLSDLNVHESSFLLLGSSFLAVLVELLVEAPLDVLLRLPLLLLLLELRLLEVRGILIVLLLQLHLLRLAAENGLLAVPGDLVLLLVLIRLPASLLVLLVEVERVVFVPHIRFFGAV